MPSVKPEPMDGFSVATEAMEALRAECRDLREHSIAVRRHARVLRDHSMRMRRRSADETSDGLDH